MTSQLYPRGLVSYQMASTSNNTVRPVGTASLVEPILNTRRFAASVPLEPNLPTPKPPTTYKFASYNVPSSRQNKYTSVAMESAANGTSISQQLAGPANPKTRVAPIIVQPLGNLDYWKASTLVTNSHVNDQTNFDTYHSGYQTMTCCNNPNPQSKTFRSIQKKETRQADSMLLPPQNVLDSDNKANYFSKQQPQYYPPEQAFQAEMSIPQPPVTKEMFAYSDDSVNPLQLHPLYSTAQDYASTPLPYALKGKQKDTDNVIDTSYGYYPENPSLNGLPVNSPYNSLPAYKEHNQNVYTQTLQPGIYSTTQVAEPVTSNYGISFTQPLEPISVMRRKRSDSIPHAELLYTQHNPLTYKAPPRQKQEESYNSPNTVFDPRLTGYGAEDRSYTEPTTGQTRYFYDDINAVRMPNYITRNNIDIFDFAPTYGVMPDATSSTSNASDQMHTFANQNFIAQTNAQRANIQQSLFRKNGQMVAQQRMAPFRRH